jgi:hypothetical protein
MIIRHALNFTVHLAAGIAVGALAVTAGKLLKRRAAEDWRPPARPAPRDDTVDAVPD